MMWSVEYRKVECDVAMHKMLKSQMDHSEFGLEGGSVGGTPHSCRPFGRWMRLDSQSSSACAVRRWTYLSNECPKHGITAMLRTKYSSLMSNFFLSFFNCSSSSFVT